MGTSGAESLRWMKFKHVFLRIYRNKKKRRGNDEEM